MADNLTIERFIKTLARCGLFERDDLQTILKQSPNHVRKDSKQLARWLIDEHYLTIFQAGKLLRGIWQGLVLGPYHILSPIGKGGMGVVYLARQIHEGLPKSQLENPKERQKRHLVALKILPPHRARSETRTLERFLREMQMAHRVDHPFLTKTYDAGEIQGVYYIAMEYIRGRTLSQVVASQGPLEVHKVAKLFEEVTIGLAHAHAMGLIHRDLKPSNIMITRRGKAKILDLGLALVKDEERPEDKSILGGRGYVVGTMDFIAPEQVTDSTSVDHRADLYSLGCSMYFSLTGHPPFPGGTSVQKMQRHRFDIPQPIQQLNPSVPDEFVAVIEQLMAKKKEDRIPDSLILRELLQPFIDLEPSEKERQILLDLQDSTDSLAISDLADDQIVAETLWNTIPLLSDRPDAEKQILEKSSPALFLPYQIESKSDAPLESLNLQNSSELANQRASWKLFWIIALATLIICLLIIFLEVIRY